MDSAKLKKLQDYSIFLTQQAEAKETRGESAEAVKDYMKLVDVLLLLANDAKDHPTWQQLIGKAEEYQRKARALAEPGADRGSPRAAPIIPHDGRVEKVDSNDILHETGMSSPNRFRTLRKFPSLIGRKGELASSETKSEPSSVAAKNWSGEVIKKPALTGSELMLPNISSGSTQISALTLEGKTEQSGSAFSKLLDEKAKLQREVEFLKEKEKEYLEAIEAKDRMYADAVSNMVPKSEYAVLLTRLEDSVPRAEYEQALAISAIPKERYIELQSQLTDLEIRLANSVPRIIVDEVAEYVSYLASTVFPTSSGEQKIESAPEQTSKVASTEGPVQTA